MAIVDICFQSTKIGKYATPTEHLSYTFSGTGPYIGAYRAVWVPGQDLATPHLMRNCGKCILSLHCTLYVRLCVPHLSRKITYLVMVSGTNASPVSVSHHESPSHFFAMVGDHVYHCKK